MEYSVFDLVKILLKKWYIILISMVLFAGLSLLLSDWSYEEAVENYTNLTQQAEDAADNIYQEVPVEPGEETGEYVCDLRYSLQLSEADLSAAAQEEKIRIYQELLQTPALTQEQETLLALLETERLYENMTASLARLYGDAAVQERCLNTLQKDFPDSLFTQEDFSLTKHLSAAPQPAGSFLKLIVRDLQEADAAALCEAYLAAVCEEALSRYGMEIRFTVSQQTFTVTPQKEYSAENEAMSEFIPQAVTAPGKPPQAVRVIGMALLIGFMLSCFGVLLYTFIKDSAAQQKKQAKVLSSQGADTHEAS